MKNHTSIVETFKDNGITYHFVSVRDNHGGATCLAIVKGSRYASIDVNFFMELNKCPMQTVNKLKFITNFK